MRYAIVHNEKVINLIEWDGKSKYKPTKGELVKVGDVNGVSVGWIYKNDKFKEPASLKADNAKL